MDHEKKLIAGSSAMQRVSATIEEIVTSWRNGGRLSLLLLGPSGAGKGEVVQEIGRRLGGKWPLMRVDCSARGDMLRDDLLGHARGAFTGASGPRAGLLAAASAGVLFLDEIGDLSDENQRLLRDILGSETYIPIGADRAIKIECRVIAATNRDLWTESQAGRFREDLYWRVARRVETMPALAERIEDVPAIAAELVARSGSGSTLSRGCDAVLMGHDWPGNVRELETVLACAAAVAGPRQPITPGILAGELARRQRVIEECSVSVDPACGDYRMLAMTMAANDDGITRADFQERSGLSRAWAWRVLESLVETGRLIREREGRSFRYWYKSYRLVNV